MLKNLILVFFAALFVAGFGYANAASANLVIVQTPRTAPTDGKQMYSNYCASCHGVDGKGTGPAASVLTTRPTDLTLLSKNNSGKFPDVHVISVLQFGTEKLAHGTEQMPVWGPVFGKMNSATPQERALRISNLTRYLQTLQR